MNSKGSISKSGVFVYDSYKDNIIVDRYNRVFRKMRASKLDAIRSENSEDAMTWNVFRTLQKINPELWLPALFSQSFQNFREDIVKDMKISLWKRFSPPPFLVLPEGDSEIDVMLENNQFVWFIEVRYKSDISVKTTHDETRNQLIHNIEIGSDYAKHKDFYFSLLILNEKFSPKGKQLLEIYQQNPNTIMNNLPHREAGLKNLKGISLVKWEEISKLLVFCEDNAEYEDERQLARFAKIDLEKRISQQ